MVMVRHASAELADLQNKIKKYQLFLIKTDGQTIYEEKLKKNVFLFFDYNFFYNCCFNS